MIMPFPTFCQDVETRLANALAINALAGPGLHTPRVELTSALRDSQTLFSERAMITSFVLASVLVHCADLRIVTTGSFRSDVFVG